MDIQLIFIILIFLFLFIFERIDNMKEMPKEMFAVVRPGYTNPSPFLDLRYNPVPFSVNYGKKERGFLNFGSFGSYPANPLCSSCTMTGNNVSPPYLRVNDLGDEYGDLKGKVSTTCNSLCGKNYDSLNNAFLVEGRSAGRPRQCRRLL